MPTCTINKIIKWRGIKRGGVCTNFHSIESLTQVCYTFTGIYGWAMTSAGIWSKYTQTRAPITFIVITGTVIVQPVTWNAYKFSHVTQIHSKYVT